MALGAGRADGVGVGGFAALLLRLTDEAAAAHDEHVRGRAVIA
jgi:hypothetical protein